MINLYLDTFFDRTCMLTEITDKDYLLAKNHSIWSETKQSQYGKGLANTNSDPSKVTRIGTLGEIAFGNIINQSVDFTYRVNGDKQDFIVNNITVDIKTSTKMRSTCYILYETEKGKIIKPEKDIYILAHILYDNLNENSAAIVFSGYYTNKMLESCIIRDGAYNAGHKNLVLDVEKSLSFLDFINVYTKRRIKV